MLWSATFSQRAEQSGVDWGLEWSAWSGVEYDCRVILEVECKLQLSGGGAKDSLLCSCSHCTLYSIRVSNNGNVVVAHVCCALDGYTVIVVVVYQ